MQERDTDAAPRIADGNESALERLHGTCWQRQARELA